MHPSAVPADRPSASSIPGRHRVATLVAAAIGLFSAMADAATGAATATPRDTPKEVTMQATGNTILITGGGSGIGRELARRFHDQGNTVIVAGRRLEPLQATIDGRPRMHAMLLDLERPDAIEAFARSVTAEHPGLNVLINNAGIMRVETLSARRALDDAEETIVTNLLGPIRLTNALVDHLLAQPGATIVNVSSGLAFVPRTDAATYSASKAAIHSYTVSLRHQLRGRAKVIELAPPGVQTELNPGQSTRDGYMPLQDFIGEVMGLFAQQPVPDEILVDRVTFQRLAEREGRFDDALERVNAR